MKILAILLVMNVGSFNPELVGENILNSFENFVTEACDTPDPGNEDHYE